jgi:hypothetical protein
VKLGIQISEAPVSKYMPRWRKPASQTWRAFLENHVGTLVSMDFFTVPSVFFHVLFVFVVLVVELAVVGGLHHRLYTRRAA